MTDPNVLSDKPALLNLLADTGWARAAHWLLAEARWHANRYRYLYVGYSLAYPERHAFPWEQQGDR